ncbi:MAG TPA: hypothetical protein VK907_04295 [Phnomibacter sp.]|nr:hypothetical protein [Phnomibacter sp.]
MKIVHYILTCALWWLAIVHGERTYGQAGTVGNPDTLPMVRVFSDSISDFEIDNLGNLYLLGQRQQLKKLTATFDSLAVFNDMRQFGKLYSIDVSNPLKVLLFYKDHGSIIILDRFLNVRSTLNLRLANLQQVTAITQSYDNNIWVYDELENMVKKIDESGRELLSSPDLRVVFDDPPQIQTMHDFNKYLYAYDVQRGLLVMDYFGAYRNKLAFLGWRNLQGIGQGIVATDDKGLVYYRPGTINTRNRPLPDHILASKKIRIQDQRLYALGHNGRLTVYRLDN